MNLKSHLVPVIESSIPESLHCWLLPALQSVQCGEQTVGLLCCDNALWFWQLAALEFEIDTIEPVRDLFASAFPENDNQLVKLYFSDCEFQRMETSEQLVELSNTHRCGVQNCSVDPLIPGRLATVQLREQSEISISKGNMFPCGEALIRRKYYCIEHAICNRAQGINRDRECTDLLKMVTTRLSNSLFVEHLDGHLFCAIHAPAGPSHLPMRRKHITVAEQ